VISKCKFYFCLALAFVAIASQKISAQPGGGWTHRSLEARVAQAPRVFRGTITNVVETLTPTNNELARRSFPDLPFRTFDFHNYKITLTVDEVLKGKLDRKSIEFAITNVADWPELKQWEAARATFLWFVNDSLDSIAANFFAGENDVFLEMKASRKANEDVLKKFPVLYDADMTLLANSQQILKRARAFAKKAGPFQFHSIYLPQESSSDHFYFNSYLVVPVEPALEKTARHLIASPDDFISANNTPASVPQWRCDLRAQGVNALRHFKSAQNIKLLKSLLNSPDFWEIKDWSTENRDLNRNIRTYSVRKMAYDVLKEWNVDAAQPIFQETVSADGPSH
jgi:hypothetical protein